MYSTKSVDTVSVKQHIQLNKLFIVQSDNVLDQERRYGLCKTTHTVKQTVYRAIR